MFLFENGAVLGVELLADCNIWEVVLDCMLTGLRSNPLTEVCLHKNADSSLLAFHAYPPIIYRLNYPLIISLKFIDMRVRIKHR